MTFIAAAGALVAAFVLATVARSAEPLGLDQGLFACFGEWPGRLPYRDVFDSKPPLFLYTWILAWNAGGGSVTGVWCVEAVWLAATMGLAFVAGARLWSRWVGLGAAALVFVGLWAPGLGGWSSRAQAEELLALPLIGAAWLALRAVERPRLALACGVLTGAVGLFKVPALAVAVAWLVLFAATCRPWRGAATRAAWLGAGLAAPWLIAIAWFAAHGALDDAYRSVFVYAGQYADVIAPSWASVLRGFARTVTDGLMLPLALAAVGLAVTWRRDRVRAWWLTVWIASTALAVVAQRQLAGYHFLLLAPGLALAGGVGLVALVEWVGAAAAAVAARVAAGVALMVVLALGFATVDDWRGAYGPGARHRLGSLARDRYLRGFDRGIVSPRVEDEVARHVRAGSAPGDGLLVWGLAPGIYPLAARHPVTRYPFHKMMLTDAPLSRRVPGLAARRAALMASLTRDPPRYIVVGTRDVNGFEPEESVASLARFEALARFVDDGYRREAQIGRFLILRRVRDGSRE